MIHIEETNPAIAAQQVGAILERSTGPWLVWSACDEGYMLAPASSREAQSIRTYWAETVIGEMGSAVDIATLRALLGKAATDVARVQLEMCDGARRDARNRWVREYRRKKARMAA